jgi:hypothetical protein
MPSLLRTLAIVACLLTVGAVGTSYADTLAEREADKKAYMDNVTITCKALSPNNAAYIGYCVGNAMGIRSAVQAAQRVHNNFCADILRRQAPPYDVVAFCFNEVAHLPEYMGRYANDAFAEDGVNTNRPTSVHGEEDEFTKSMLAVTEGR